MTVAEGAQPLLDSGTALSAGAAAAGIDLHALYDLYLLTAKPFLYVFTVDVTELADEDLRQRPPSWWPRPRRSSWDTRTEADLAELPEDDAAELLAGAGMGEPSLAKGACGRECTRAPSPAARRGSRAQPVTQGH
jgi:hypothetical protein